MSRREKIKNILTRIIAFHNKLDIRQKLYLNLILAILLFITCSFFLEPQTKKYAFIILLMYWSTVVAFELIRVYKKIYSHTLGKAFLLLGFTLCTNISFSIAGLIVNEITGVSPSNFPHTLVLISIAIIPLMTAIIMFLIYACIFATMALWAPFIFIYDNKFKKLLFPAYEYQDGYFLYKTTRLVQIFSMGIYCVFIYSLCKNILDDYSKFIDSNSKSFIYTFEMFPKSPCVGLPPGKVAFINDDHVLHASKQGEDLKFTTYSCEYKKDK